MREINATSEGLFDARPEQVYAAFLDEATGRAHWWRPSLDLRPRAEGPAGQLGSEFEIHVQERRPIHFTGRFTELVENRLARIDYFEGDFVGEGLWTFEPANGGTRVRYRWHVRPNRWPLRIVSTLMDIGAGHEAVVQRGFEGLRGYLQAQRRPPPAPARMTVQPENAR